MVLLMLLAKLTFLTKHLFTFFVMNDIVHSQEKSMEGHLQFLFKVRVKGGGASNQKRAWREHGYFLDLHTIVSAKYKLFHFLWKYGQIDEAS